MRLLGRGLLGALLTGIAGCATEIPVTKTYWRPASTNAYAYSNQDGVARFEFRHAAGVVFTLYLGESSEADKLVFFGEFLIPAHARIQFENREFEISDNAGTPITAQIANLEILDEQTKRMVIIPVDRELIGASKTALAEARRHRLCNFYSTGFKISSATTEITIPTIKVNGAIWSLPKLLLKKETGKVFRGFSP